MIVRKPVDPFAWQFVIYFATVPALAATVFAVLAGWAMPVGGFAPLVILSGLAVVLLAGNGIELSHQHIAIGVWFGLLLVPPVLAVLAVFVMPWIGVDLNVNKPARQIAQFFSESFQRRTGMTYVGWLITLLRREPAFRVDLPREHSELVRHESVLAGRLTELMRDHPLEEYLAEHAKTLAPPAPFRLGGPR